MTSLTRYVLKQLVVGMVLVTAGLTCVIWLSQSLRFIEMIVNRGLTAGKFVYLTMLLLPNFLTIILPIAVFTIVVFTYSKLITDRELVVMRAAGLSQFALAKPALILALAVVTAGYAINLHLLPSSYQAFRELQWDIRYNYSQILLREGTFNNVSPGITVYVRQRTKDGQLHGILVHDQRHKDKPYTMMAARGAMVDTDGGARVVMFDGNRQEVDKSTKQLSILYFDRYVFDLQPQQSAGDIRYREPRERTLSELFDIENDKFVDPQHRGRFLVEGHKRLVQPLSGLAFTLIGLACLISGAFSRRAQTRQIITAAAITVALQALAMGIENLAAKNIRLIPLMYISGVIPVVVAYFYMIHAPAWRRRPAPASS